MQDTYDTIAFGTCDSLAFYPLYDSFPIQQISQLYDMTWLIDKDYWPSTATPIGVNIDCIVQKICKELNRLACPTKQSKTKQVRDHFKTQGG